MALTDLLNNITSFDYTQVGQPQSFEANGRLVTGQQTFDRPIEEPLPITEKKHCSAGVFMCAGYMDTPRIARGRYKGILACAIFSGTYRRRNE